MGRFIGTRHGAVVFFLLRRVGGIVGGRLLNIRTVGSRCLACALLDGVAVAGDRGPVGGVARRRGRVAAAAVHDVYQRRVIAVGAVAATAGFAVRGRRAGVVGRRVRGIEEVQMERVLVVVLLLRGLLLCRAAGLAAFVAADKLGKGDVGRAADGAGAGRMKHSKVTASSSSMLRIGGWLGATNAVYRSAERVSVTTSLGRDVAVLGAGFQENAALFGAIRRRRSETAGHRSQTPFLDVGLDKYEARLAQVDVHGGRAVGADSRKEVLRLEPVHNLVELLAVAGEENGAGPRPVANADDVALDEARAVGGLVEGLVVMAGAVGVVCDRVFMVSWTRLAREAFGTWTAQRRTYRAGGREGRAWWPFRCRAGCFRAFRKSWPPSSRRRFVWVRAGCT